MSFDEINILNNNKEVLRTHQQDLGINRMEVLSAISQDLGTNCMKLLSTTPQDLGTLTTGIVTLYGMLELLNNRLNSWH
jgi:hypothetical protein